MKFKKSFIGYRINFQKDYSTQHLELYNFACSFSGFPLVFFIKPTCFIGKSPSKHSPHFDFLRGNRTMELYWFQIPVWWTTLVCFVICVGALPDTCSDITIPICLDLPYNKTIYPNLLRHLSQEEASLELYTYFPLLKANCSDDIQLFLCSMYVPVCNPLNHALPPCRSLCNSARKCEDIMQKFGYAWPESFRLVYLNTW